MTLYRHLVRPADQRTSILYGDSVPTLCGELTVITHGYADRIKCQRCLDVQAARDLRTAGTP